MKIFRIYLELLGFIGPAYLQHFATRVFVTPCSTIFKASISIHKLFWGSVSSITSHQNLNKKVRRKGSHKIPGCLLAFLDAFFPSPDHHVLRCVEGIHNFSRRGSSSLCLNTYLGISMAQNRGR